MKPLISLFHYTDTPRLSPEDQGEDSSFFIITAHSGKESDILTFSFSGQGSPHYRWYISSLQSKGSVLSGKPVIVAKLVRRKMFPHRYIPLGDIGQGNRIIKFS